MFNIKFKNIHNNIELMETLQFKNYIKSIVEEIIEENTQEDLVRKIAGLEAMMQDRSTTSGEKENASNLKKKLEDKLKTLKSTEPKYGASDIKETDDYGKILASYGFSLSSYGNYHEKYDISKNNIDYELYIYPQTKSIDLYVNGSLTKSGRFNNLDNWLSTNTKLTKKK